jgi:acetyl-CoA acetyltransferase
MSRLRADRRAIGTGPERLNVNSGAIALGHLLGASHADLMTTIVHALHARATGCRRYARAAGFRT